METNCEKSIMNASEKFESTSPDAFIEAKLARIPKAFSIENLIAKKSIADVESEQQDQAFHEHRMPPIAFPQNFPFYHPWAANYLMSQANLPPNLLLNANPQQLYQLQSDKLTNFMDTQAIISNGYKDKFTELLFNPHGSTLPPEQVTTYLHQHPDPTTFNGKLKDTNFLNEFYSNYFMNENNRLMMSAASDNNNVKRTKKQHETDNCNNDSSSEFDVVNDDCGSKSEVKSGMYYEDDSYSDLSVTTSPDHSKVLQDKGVLSSCGLRLWLESKFELSKSPQSSC
jgi:hypothetical protein